VSELLSSSLPFCTAGRAFAFAGGGVQIRAFCVRMHDSALAAREKVMAG